MSRMTGAASRSSLRVVHVSFAVDPHQRDGAALLRAWPTLPSVAKAVADAGVDVTVVQAAHRRETVYLNDIPFHFVDDTRATPLRVAGIPWPRRPTKILDVVAAAAPTVLHVQGFHYPLVIRQLARHLRVPILVQDHGTASLR